MVVYSIPVLELRELASFPIGCISVSYGCDTSIPLVDRVLFLVLVKLTFVCFFPFSFSPLFFSTADGGLVVMAHGLKGMSCTNARNYITERVRVFIFVYSLVISFTSWDKKRFLLHILSVHILWKL